MLILLNMGRKVVEENISNVDNIGVNHMPYSNVRHLETVSVKKEPHPHFDPPLTIWQGPLFRNLNKLSSNPQAAYNFLQSFLPIKDGALTLLDVFLAHGLVHMGGEYQHLRDHWFCDAQSGWWPGQHVEEKMRDALEEAFTRVITTGLPLQCYWVIYDRFKENKDQNEVFIRISNPVKPPAAYEAGTYQDHGFYSILFQVFTPVSCKWQT
jgi:hypothetical protein